MGPLLQLPAVGSLERQRNDVPTHDTLHPMRGVDRWLIAPPTSLLVDLFFDRLPEHGEHEALHSVGDDLGLQAAAEQTDHTVLRDHVLHGLDVRDALRVRLFPFVVV